MNLNRSPISFGNAAGMSAAGAGLTVLSAIILTIVAGVFVAIALKVIDLISPGTPARLENPLRALSRYAAAYAFVFPLSLILTAAASAVIHGTRHDASIYEFAIHAGFSVTAIGALYAFRRPHNASRVTVALALLWMPAAGGLLIGYETVLGIMSQMTFAPIFAFFEALYGIFGFDMTDLPTLGSLIYELPRFRFEDYASLSLVAFFTLVVTTAVFGYLGKLIGFMCERGWLDEPRAVRTA